MLIGVIADTHGFLDPRVPELFAGVEHILHAGDIGPYRILHQLERIAPVTAVLGNNDVGLACREFENISLEGVPFFLQHIVDPLRPDPQLKRRLETIRPGAVVFGHTHRQYASRHQGILFLNPGYAGKQRFDLQRSVALLRITDGASAATFHELSG